MMATLNSGGVDATSGGCRGVSVTGIKAVGRGPERHRQPGSTQSVQNSSDNAEVRPGEQGAAKSDGHWTTDRRRLSP